jgi:hypothetical protein
MAIHCCPPKLTVPLTVLGSCGVDQSATSLVNGTIRSSTEQTHDKVHVVAGEWTRCKNAERGKVGASALDFQTELMPQRVQRVRVLQPAALTEADADRRVVHDFVRPRTRVLPVVRLKEILVVFERLAQEARRNARPSGLRTRRARVPEDIVCMENTADDFRRLQYNRIWQTASETHRHSSPIP